VLPPLGEEGTDGEGEVVVAGPADVVVKILGTAGQEGDVMK
jgi:hypothetical protein